MTSHSSDHVASVVKVKKRDGSEVDMIIDPSVFARPVTFDEWIHAISSHNCVQTKDASRAPDDACAYEFTERFTFNGANSYLKEINWCPEDVQRADSMMREDLPQALARRAKHAEVSGPNGRIVPSGACWQTGGNTDDLISIYHTQSHLAALLAATNPSLLWTTQATEGIQDPFIFVGLTFKEQCHEINGSSFCLILHPL